MAPSGPPVPGQCSWMPCKYPQGQGDRCTTVCRKRGLAAPQGAGPVQPLDAPAALLEPTYPHHRASTDPHHPRVTRPLQSHMPCTPGHHAGPTSDAARARHTTSLVHLNCRTACARHARFPLPNTLKRDRLAYRSHFGSRVAQGLKLKTRQAR